jgi:hypothetical protein
MPSSSLQTLLILVAHGGRVDNSDGAAAGMVRQSARGGDGSGRRAGTCQSRLSTHSIPTAQDVYRSRVQGQSDWTSIAH